VWEANRKVFLLPENSRGRLIGASVTALVAAAVLLYWLSLPTAHDDSTSSSTIARATATVEPADAHVDLPQPTMDMADSIAPQPAPAAAEANAPASPKPPVPHVTREGNTLRMYVAPEFFAAKYANASTAELEAARAVIGAEVSTLMREASKSFLDGGGGISEVVPRQPLSDDAAMPPGEKAYDLDLTERTRVQPDGQLLKQHGSLPWEQNQAFYDKNDEEMWLLAELARRERVAVADPSTHGK
jgi:type IV secretory pathway VirB10-like protein